MRRSTLLLGAAIGFADNDSHVRTWLWLLTIGLPVFVLYAALVRSLLPAVHRDVFFAGAVTFVAETAVQGWLWGALAFTPAAPRPAPPRSSSTPRATGGRCSRARR